MNENNNTRRLHFIKNKPSPMFRCRLFGHKHETATAYDNIDEIDGYEVKICRRCNTLQNQSWDGIKKVLQDGGKDARSE